MPVLQLDDQQFPLKAGATRIGAGAGADVVVPGYSAVGVEAIIDAGPTPTIRRADDAAHVRVNGVLLGAEPTPLMHGDKVEVAGLELRYADDAKVGATQFQSASDIAAAVAAAGAKRSGAARATAASGGRLVSLVDGKEYSVPAGGLVMGRDAACDVVVGQNEVSRRHAEIAPGEQGYVLKDTSANGLFVNGQRIQGSHLLARSDVIRVGTEEFRFYADVLAPTPAVSSPAIPSAPRVETPAAATPAQLDELELVPETAFASASSAPPAPSAPPVAIPTPPAVPKVLAPVAPTPTPAPAAPIAPPAPVADTRPVLATLETINPGPAKGTKYELRSPLSHIGRGAHNDVLLSDESVSESHAKIQRREDGWYLVDMDSTNGSYVGGNRVTGEKKIDGSPDVRFGGLKFRFAAVGASDVDVKGTRTIAPVSRPSSMAATQGAAKTPPAPAAAPASTAKPEPEKKGGIPVIVWIVVVLAVVGAVAFFLLKGKA